MLLYYIWLVESEVKVALLPPNDEGKWTTDVDRSVNKNCFDLTILRLCVTLGKKKKKVLFSSQEIEQTSLNGKGVLVVKYKFSAFIHMVCFRWRAPSPCCHQQNWKYVVKLNYGTIIIQKEEKCCWRKVKSLLGRKGFGPMRPKL